MTKDCMCHSYNSIKPQLGNLRLRELRVLQSEPNRRGHPEAVYLTLSTCQGRYNVCLFCTPHCMCSNQIELDLNMAMATTIPTKIFIPEFQICIC